MTSIYLPPAKSNQRRIGGGQCTITLPLMVSLWCSLSMMPSLSSNFFAHAAVNVEEATAGSRVVLKGKEAKEEGGAAAGASSRLLDGMIVPNAVVLYGPGVQPNLLSYQWKIRKYGSSTAEKEKSSAPPPPLLHLQSTSLFVTISTNLTIVPATGEAVVVASGSDDKFNKAQRIEACLTTALNGAKEGAPLSLSVCTPSDIDTAQPDERWIFGADTMIRPVTAPSLCLTTNAYMDRNDPNTPYFRAFLAACDPDNSRQRHAYDGPAPGNDDPQYGLWMGASYLQVMTAFPERTTTTTTTQPKQQRNE